MATINVAAPTFARTVVPKPARFCTSPVLGLPQFRIKGTTIRCSATKDQTAASSGAANSVAATLLAAASMSAGPALALVDERMSTEGTGLSLGISNNLLGWILLGVFGLIWSLYTVYSTTLDDDEETGGLSL